jgi:Kef-type K+ transport system membrane component KefB
MQGVSDAGLEMAIFMFAILVGSIIANKIKQSALVGQILIGILIGPSILGIVRYNEFVREVSDLGIIVLLFIVGLECKFKEVYTAKNILIAILGAIVPFSFGFLTGYILGFNHLQSLFLGAAITSTSSAVVASTLRQTDMLKSPLGKVIMGACAVDDIAGLIILSVVIKISEVGFSIEAVVNRVVLAVLFLFVFFIVGVKISKYLRRLEYWGAAHGHHNLGFIFTLMLAFLYASISETIGLSAIMGAFVAGLSLEHIENKNFRLGAEYFEMIFGSIFFVSLGILINNLIDPLKNIMFVGIILAVAIAAKYTGSFVGAKLSNINKRESMVISVGMVPIGEIAAIAALVALEKGIFDNSTYSSIILAGIVTCILAPIVLKNMFGRIDSRQPYKFNIRHKRPAYYNSDL